MFQTNEQSVTLKNLMHQCRSWLMLYLVSKYFMVHWSAKLQGLAQCSIMYTIQQCFNTFLQFLINTKIRRQLVNCSSLNLLVSITVLELRIAFENLIRAIKHSLTVNFHLVLLDKFLWSAHRGDHKLSRPETEHVNKFCSKLILNLWKKLLKALAHNHLYKGLFWNWYSGLRAYKAYLFYAVGIVELCGVL